MKIKSLFFASVLLAFAGGCKTTSVKVSRVPIRADAHFTIAHFEVSQVDVPPMPTRAMAPRYSRDGGDGYAIVQYVADTGGIPRAVQCVEASNAALGRAGETTIAQWRFRAAEKGGSAVAAKMEQRFEFRLVETVTERGSPIGNPAPEVTRYAEETPPYPSARDPFDRGTYQHQ